MRLPLILVLFFSLLSLLSAQRYGNWNDDDHRVSGNGNVIIQDRPVSEGFTRVEVGSALQLELTQGDAHGIRVETDENLQQYILTEVNGQTLRLSIRSHTNLHKVSKMKVHVTLPRLASLETGGATKVETVTAFNGDELDIDAGGASQVKVEFVGRSLYASVGGAGVLRLKGSADQVMLKANSAGVIRGEDFTGKKVEAKANSAGSIEVGVTEELNAKANSAGSIRYQGKPGRVFTDANSGGSIRGGR